MNRPGIAVVVTCWDLGRTLEEALDSVTRQTRPPSECVIVDDGSTDIYTRQVLARLEAAGTRIVRTPNRGVGAARNTGVNLTTSPYVVLLDADDIFEPEYFERAAARLDSEASLSFVSCGMRSFGETEEVWFPPAPDLVRSLSGEVVHVSSMFRRELWEAVGGFDEVLGGHEEMDFWATALSRGCRGEVLPEVLLRYRIRPRSMSRRAIVHDTHLGWMTRIYEKHAPVLQAHAEQLILRKEAFTLEQEAHASNLLDRIRELEAERSSLDAEIATLTKDLEREGIAPVEFADLRRTTPISDTWGTDRGLPIDRYYIHAFLQKHQKDIRGHVLEVKDPGYTLGFGGNRVTRADVLDVDETNEDATILADLANASSIADNTFDCFILTQTLLHLYEPSRAIAEVFRILKPGGVLLCSVPAMGRISYECNQLDSDYWRFTEASLRNMFAELFPVDAFEVNGHGNVLVCSAFLYGLADHELTREELDANDPYFPLVYTIRAVKPAVAASQTNVAASGEKNVLAASQSSGAAVLMYHRVADDAGADPSLCISPATFRAHMKHLQGAGHAVVPLPELRSRLSTGNVPEGCVALTFDDGYAEMLSVVAPILSEFGYPFTTFVVGQSLDGPVEYWWDALRRIFFSTEGIPPTLVLHLEGGRVDVPTRSRTERTAAVSRISELMYRYTTERRQAMIDLLLEWSGAGPAPAGSPRPMRAEELVALSKYDGAGFGGHTENHVWLPAETPEHQFFQIAETRRRLQALLGREVTGFAYPYGVWGDGSVEMVNRAGYLEAVTTEELTVRDGANPLLLPRIDVGGCSESGFVERMNSFFPGFASARGR